MNATSGSTSDGMARDALERNLRALWSRFGRGPGCALHEQADALYFDTPMAVGLYEKIGFRAVAPFGIFAPSSGFHL